MEVAIGFLSVLQQQHLVSKEITTEQWMRWFDLMGMQRHTKAAGIFARLYLRDGKAGYLPDIPRTLGYLYDVAGRYPEFEGYRIWLAERIQPALQERI